MVAIRFTDGPSELLAVTDRDVLTIRTEHEAREVARALVASPDFEWPGGADADADADALEREVVDALLGGQLVLVRTERQPRPMDAPQVTDLVEHAERPEQVVEPPRPDAWVGVEIVDQRGRPLPWFHVQVSDPTRQDHDVTLSQAARGRADGLDEDGDCEVTLTVKAKPRR